MADGEQLSDFVSSQDISIGLRSAAAGHDNSRSAKQKINQANNSIQRKHVTGSNISDNNNLVEPQLETVGGVYLEDDREDEGLKTIDCTTGVNHIPRLVFLGSDEDLSRSNKDDIFFVERNQSDNLDFESKSDSYSNTDNRYTTNDENTRDNFVHPDDETQTVLTSQHSRTSIYSTDSELLADHSLDENSEIERFIMENEMTDDNLSKLMKWHCHDPKTFLLPDKMARNQLIAVSVLCFLFMIGEAVGKYYFP